MKVFKYFDKIMSYGEIDEVFSVWSDSVANQ